MDLISISCWIILPFRIDFTLCNRDCAYFLCSFVPYLKMEAPAMLKIALGGCGDLRQPLVVGCSDGQNDT